MHGACQGLHKALQDNATMPNQEQCVHIYASLQRTTFDALHGCVRKTGGRISKPTRRQEEGGQAHPPDHDLHF
eukprot:1137662-Pelagomonas_calceolata.AAC.6